MPTAISIEEARDLPWGSMKAAQFQPDGTKFATPALLTFRITDGDLPRGVKKESLRIAALEDGAWKILGGSRFDPASGAVMAPIEHFSIYGLVAQPAASSGKGTRFEINGVTAVTKASVHGRLFVAPSFISFYAEADAASATLLTISGLPADGEHHLYVNSHGDHHVLTPADGGTITLSLDLAGPSLVWIQPQPSTIVIGGGPEVDECASYGERNGDVCTLIVDVVGDIELRGGTLDCGGHSITQPATYGGSGIGVLVPPGTRGAVIEHCAIGSSSGYFAYGIEVLGADTAAVSSNLLSDNIIGVLFQGTTDSSINDNRISGGSLWAIALWDTAWSNEVAGNEVSVDNDGITIEGLAGDPESAAGNRIADNHVTRGTGGVLLADTRDNVITGNDVSGVLTALLIGGGGWPSEVYRNNFHGWVRWGVWSDIGPAEISSEIHGGNWWGKSCPGPLFTPGEDSNRVDVIDSFPYSEEDAWEGGLPPGCPSIPGDVDTDGIPDEADNCPGIQNPGQENYDGYAEGDACDSTPPPAPIIMSPADGSRLAVSKIIFQGTAETRSLVTIEECIEENDDGGTSYRCWAVASGLTVENGHFSLTSNEVMEVGAHDFLAWARDAAGNDSSRSPAVHVIVEEPPLPRPVLTDPVNDAILSQPLYYLKGYSAPSTIVRVFESGLFIGEVQAAQSGEFEFLFETPLDDGTYTFTALYLDARNAESPLSDPVSCTVRIISQEHPIIGMKGKMRIESVSDTPDPLDPRTSQSLLQVSVKTDAVAGLGGASKNHRFEAVLSWDLRAAYTGELKRSLVASTVLDRGAGGGEPVQAELQASWDGLDEFGGETRPDTLMSYDVGVKVIRVYQGPGRGPQCSRGETVTTSGSGSPACLVDSATVPDAGTIFVTIPRKPEIWVDPTTQPGLKGIYTPRYDLTPPDPAAVRAMQRVQAEVNGRLDEFLSMSDEEMQEQIDMLKEQYLAEELAFAYGPGPAHAPGNVGRAIENDASYIDIRSLPLYEGQEYRFNITPTHLGTGASVLSHLWDPSQKVEVARSHVSRDGSTIDVGSAAITYTPTRSRTYILVTHAYRTETGGEYVMFLNESRLTASPLRIRGWMETLGYAGGDYPFDQPMEFHESLGFETVLLRDGAPDTYLLLLAGNKLVAMDDDGGVGAASKITRNWPQYTRYRAVIGVDREDQYGRTMFILNDAAIDYPSHDLDMDGLGEDAEKALGTCPSRYWSPPGWDCSRVPDPGDTDEDGILDWVEIHGAYEETGWIYGISYIIAPPVLLHLWGADPKHKDVFLEADWCVSGWCAKDPLLYQPTCANSIDNPEICYDTSCPPGSKIKMQMNLDTVLGTSTSVGLKQMLGNLEASSIMNPDGGSGVSIHVDMGIDDPSCGTACGNWGGATCISKVLVGSEYNCPAYGDSYNDNMADNRKGIFHYVLMDGGGQAGGIWWTCMSGQNSSYVMAHELGHLLGLAHHGDPRKKNARDSLDCKPHYWSVMNYAYSYRLPTYSPNIFDGFVLDERNLDETDPFNAAADPWGLLFLREILGGYPFYYSVGWSADIDWNRDGVISASPVKYPLNFAETSCGALSDGAHFITTDGTTSTATSDLAAIPAVVYFGPSIDAFKNHFIFYIKTYQLSYQKIRRVPDGCDGSLRDTTACTRWSSPVNVPSQAYLGFVRRVAAETFTIDGEDLVVIVYQDILGYIKWMVMRYDSSIGYVINVRSGVIDSTGTWSTDMELEVFDDELWLAYTTSISGKIQVKTARLSHSGTWTGASMATDANGVAIVADTGLGLASGLSPLGPELLLAAAETDGTGNSKMTLRRYDTVDSLWHEDSWRLPFDLYTTTKPSMVFKPESTHANGGWYMLVFREPPGPPPYSVEDVIGMSPVVAMTDGQGNFFQFPRAHILNEWTNLPYSSYMGVTFHVLPSGRVISAYINREFTFDGGVTYYYNIPTFLPYADGVVTTEARDNDDASTIRPGLCFSLRGTTNANCFPPGARTGIWAEPVDPPMEMEPWLVE